MPIYTYLCKQCGQKNDFLVRGLTAREEFKCSRCISSQLEKIPALFGIASSASSSKGSSKCGTCPGGSCSTCS
ncbi:MAG: zinc ribbon domain-containing protein [Candidatus Omnitrophica bacterium]|nr:zinc ribbon domain-containing protein [Candidatus Omnitrophota bacterium]MBU1134697.1 zinc ribbon domain-containing protein [Candidatus Omnitrophota bacterium]MBU1523882.1 zinc ribbon domain-containing protein [Candidatus Omnitrophota bacterium]MBU1809960.1 zinc ribbon domain-containing protein [Candidatus Omnitrophota bacterium]MBU2437461.1 zinc ribbon domain-containing protein [Candidatus Omnitrophota bacterium]